MNWRASVADSAPLLYVAFIVGVVTFFGGIGPMVTDWLVR